MRLHDYKNIEGIWDTQKISYSYSFHHCTKMNYLLYVHTGIMCMFPYCHNPTNHPKQNKTTWLVWYYYREENIPYLRSTGAIPLQHWCHNLHHWCHTSAALMKYLCSLPGLITIYGNWDSKHLNQTTTTPPLPPHHHTKTTPQMWLHFKPIPGNLKSWCLVCSLILT